MCATEECGCPSGRTPRFLQPCVLLLLCKSPSYGYELIERIKEKKLSETKPDTGAIYRILRELEKNGHVKSTWATKDTGPAKRNYVITSKGRGSMHRWARSIRVKTKSLNRFLKEYGKVKHNI
jgi:DNA-binding PadR family transcriptional regulator